MSENKKYLFFLLCLCFCSIAGCGSGVLDNQQISVKDTPIPLNTNPGKSQPVKKLKPEEIASVEICCGNGRLYLSAAQMETFLSLIENVKYGKEIESMTLYGDSSCYILHMQDGTKLFYDVIQWDGGGKCNIGHTWYEAEPESVLLEINEMEQRLAGEFEEKFSMERYNGLKGNGERSIYYTKFRDRSLASCNDEICEYIKQETGGLDITKKMDVHLSNAVTELDDGNVLMHFYGTVRYRSTWEFEEISFTLLCDTKEKRVIPYR